MYRALARAGKAYLKKDDDESALRYLNKSLSEHRTPEISKLILEVSVTYNSIETILTRLIRAFYVLMAWEMYINFSGVIEKQIVGQWWLNINMIIVIDMFCLTFNIDILLVHVF